LKRLILIIALLLPLTANAGGLMMSSGTKAAAAGTACTPHDISADANLVGLWYLENNGNDETASGNNLTAQGSAAYGTSAPTPKQGTYYGDATGADADEWTIANASQTGMGTGTAISVGGWFYGDANAADGLAGKHNSSGPYGWQVFTLTTNTLMFGMSSDGTAWTSAASANNIYADSAWYHVVFVYDGSNMRLYLDGSEQTSGDFPLAYSSGWNVTTDSFYLGGRNGGTSFDGKLDEWFYTKDALSTSEISDIYNCGFTP